MKIIVLINIIHVVIRSQHGYAALSQRTDIELLKIFCEDFGYTPCTFHAMQSVENRRLPIYHTNVMMCVADKYAIVCLDCIDDTFEKESLRNRLFVSEKELLIELTEAQIRQFAGNMLQVKNRDGVPLLVMSQTAFDSLTTQQKTILNSYNEIVPVNISTIERNGGGSARCMMAEIYNPILR